MMHICGDINNIIGKGEEMRRKKVHSTLIAAALTCSMAVTPVLAAPDTLEDLQNQQKELENQKESAQGELSSLKTELETLMGKIDDLEEQLIAKGEEIIQAEKDLDAAEEKRQEQYDAMKLRIKYMYEAGSGTATMEKVMSSGDISSMLTQAEYSQQVHEYDREQLQEYADTVAEIQDLQDTLETEMANLESLEAEFQQQQEELDATIASKQDEISNLDSLIEEASQKVQEERDRQAAEAAERQRQQEAERADNDSDGGGGNTGGGSSGGGYEVSTGNVVVNRAYNKLGCPYKWGAVGPDTFDCSGFVGYCLTGEYQRRWTSGAFYNLPEVSDPRPGDICSRRGHCGIYIGGGKMIHAPSTGDVVKISNVPSNMKIVRF